MGTERAVIFVNGELGDASVMKEQLRPGDYLVAADGGLHHLEALGLRANLVIGDLDSAPPELVSRAQAAGAEVRRFPGEKDQTDLELALQAVMERGCRRILIAAGLGSRVDQTLGNIFLLGLPELDLCDVRLDDGTVEVFLVRDKGHISGSAGDSVSLIPLSASVSGVSTTGLRYPLQDETLQAGRTRGISNEMLGESSSIRIKEGRLLCVHRRKGVEG